MDLSVFEFVRLKGGASVPPFTCGDADLDEFITQDAAHYAAELYATTYLFVSPHDGKLVAFFSLANDRLTRGRIEAETWAGRIVSDVPVEMQNMPVPATLLARLGVCSDMQGYGLGAQIIDLIKYMLVMDNHSGCRLITVDAYNNPQTLGFYKRNGFLFVLDDEQKRTRRMIYDLKRTALAITEAGPPEATLF